MRTRPPRNADSGRRQGGGGLSGGNNWSVRHKALHSPEIEQHRGRVEVEFLRFARVPIERLSWVTIIGQPLVVAPGEHADAVGEAFRDLERKLVARCRRYLPNMKIRGVHEVDVLSSNACRIGRHKADLLQSLDVDVATVPTDHRILVPHMHCVIDRATHSAERLAEHLRAEFRGPWRTLVKPLYNDSDHRSNLQSLAGYCSKMKVAYSDAWCNRLTKFADVYENCWVETIYAIVGGIGLDNLYFSHGCAGLPSDDV